MKYNARKLSNGDWAVFKNRSRYWTSTTTASRDQAEAKAAEFSASWHLEQAEKLLAKMALASARCIAHEANNIVDAVENRCRDEDPDFDETDPRGWLA